jgi:hypothetical protein
MTHTVQTPHRFAHYHLAITPVNGMALPSQRETDKWTGSLLIRCIHRRHTPKASVSLN